MPQPDSFVFAGVDMLDAYGIRCISHDAILPQIRSRTAIIPERSGSLDLGAKYYNDRLVTLDCASMRALTRSELRELAGLLARKGRLVLWDEPDKYYVGRIYKQEELVYVGRVGHAFQLTFTCDPFAYGETRSIVISDSSTPFPASGYFPQYQGTAPTPTVLTIDLWQATASGTNATITITERGGI